MKYLHNIWVLKVVRREYLQLELVRDMTLVHAALRIILIWYQVGDNIGLANIDQKAISDNYGTLELGKSSVAFSEVPYSVLSVQRIELNVKLSALVIVASTHHRIN